MEDEDDSNAHGMIHIVYRDVMMTLSWRKNHIHTSEMETMDRKTQITNNIIVKIMTPLPTTSNGRLR
jgi:hypothetical protein